MWLQFIADMAGSCGWPSVVLTTVLVILLRYPKPISQILSSLRLQRITSNWGEGAFGDEVGVLNAGADKAMIPPAHPDAVVEGAATFTGGGQLSATGTVIGGDTEGFDARIAALAAVSPLAAVAWAWQQVRQRLAQVVEPFMREGHHIRLDLPLRDIKMLDDGGYIDAETAYLLNDLALLSNRVLHKSSAADEVTYADALEYGRLAKRMLQRLAEVKIP